MITRFSDNISLPQIFIKYTAHMMFTQRNPQTAFPLQQLMCMFVPTFSTCICCCDTRRLFKIKCFDLFITFYTFSLGFVNVFLLYRYKQSCYLKVTQHPKHKRWCHITIVKLDLSEKINLEIIFNNIASIFSPSPVCYKSSTSQFDLTQF